MPRQVHSLVQHPQDFNHIALVPDAEYQQMTPLPATARDMQREQSARDVVAGSRAGNSTISAISACCCRKANKPIAFRRGHFAGFLAVIAFSVTEVRWRVRALTE